MQIIDKYRLVLLFLFFNALLAMGMIVIGNWGFEKKFLAYLTQLEIERYAPLLEELAETYSEQQSWETLLNDTGDWDNLVLAHTKHTLDLPLFSEGNYPESPPRNRQRIAEIPEIEPVRIGVFDLQLLLTDVDHNRLIGSAEVQQTVEAQQSRVIWLDIVSNAAIVGYLGINRIGQPESSQEALFIQEQKISHVWIALCSVLIALGIVFIFAEVWMRPTRKLQNAMAKLTEGHFNQRLDQPGALAGRFNTLARTLDENRSIQKQWVADFSHELRTPLAILIGEIGALIDGTRPTNKEQLQSLNEEAIHLQNLVAQLHELNLSDLGSLNYKMALLDFSSFFSTMAQHIALVCEKEGVDFQYIDTNESPAINVDEQKFRQLFANLFNNTLRHTDRPGLLKIEWRVSNKKLTIRWSDSSPTVGDMEKSKLFDRLYRTEGSRNRRSGGSGLGLAIVKTIVEAHDGEIKVADSELGGLEFTLKFPVH